MKLANSGKKNTGAISNADGSQINSMKIEKSTSASKPKTKAKPKSQKACKNVKIEVQISGEKKKQVRGQKKNRKLVRKRVLELGVMKITEALDEFKESNMDDVKPVIPTSTFDEIAAPIFAPHGFCLHTHASLRNAILKIVKSYQDILYESEGLTVISGREGTCRKKIAMLSANVAYASKPGSVYFLDITPGQYIHYKKALDDINRAHENDHTILMLYMCLDCYANASCHTNVLYQTFFEAMSNFYKYWDTSLLGKLVWKRREIRWGRPARSSDGIRGDTRPKILCC